MYNLICIGDADEAPGFIQTCNLWHRPVFRKELQGFLMMIFKPEMQSVPISYEPHLTLSVRVAAVIKEQLLQNPRSVFGLPTGRTPTDVYDVLSRWTKEGELSWEQARCFGLDEYYNVDTIDSFRNYLEQNLYRNINLPTTSRFNPLAHDDYDQIIADNGGLDLTILGIGKNGHIAFNEPGTPLESWTHCVYLTESTRQANAEQFQASPVPTKAVTMGIQTILASKRILLMASGKQKKGILTQALMGPISNDVPASLLQLHKNILIMADFE
jgi:glucosamine-6-phosphate deaminase